MLHRRETWPVRKENEVALQRAETSMVRWMCNVKVNDRVPSKELRERLGRDDTRKPRKGLRSSPPACTASLIVGS